MVVPPRSMLMGIPGRIVRRVTEEDVAWTRATNRRYRELARESLEGKYVYRLQGAR